VNGLAAAAAVLAALYVGDLVVAKVRGDGALDTVKLNILYVTPLKASRVDYTSGGVQDVECVRALFPHFGDWPCWYARRQTSKHVDQ
jgi:hypothetical protein